MMLLDYLNQDEIKKQLVMFTFNGIASGTILITLQMANDYYALRAKGSGSYESQAKVAKKHNKSKRTVRLALQFMRQKVVYTLDSDLTEIAELKKNGLI